MGLDVEALQMLPAQEQVGLAAKCCYLNSYLTCVGCTSTDEEEELR